MYNGRMYRLFPTELTKAVHQVVKVDYFVHGCPIYIPEFVKVIKAAWPGSPTTCRITRFALSANSMKTSACIRKGLPALAR